MSTATRGTAASASKTASKGVPPEILRQVKLLELRTRGLVNSLFTGEYRWRPSRYVDMALFMDAGQVAADRHQFDTKEFDVDWGIGIRFHGPNFNALRLEFSNGREGYRLTFAGSQPF